MRLSDIYRISPKQQESDERSPSVIETETDDDETFYDDDDFWESIDLLETARKAITKLVIIGEDTLEPVRLHMLTRLCNDIGQFVGNFVDTTPLPEIDVIPVEQTKE